MKASIKIMSTGSGYTDPSVMITNGNQKYCFNMGNGIHRQSLGSNHSKPADSDILFLTHLDPSTETDFLNYVLRNREDLSIIGPNGLTSNLMSYRYFLSKRYKTFYITECSSDESFHLSDGHLSVYPVVIKSSNDSSSSQITAETTITTNDSLNKLPFTFNKSFGAIERPTNNNSMRVAVGSSKSFYDWTILRGGIIHSSTGSEFTMGEIEQYASYRLLKEDIKAGTTKISSKEELLQFKPKNSKEIKKFLLDNSDSNYNLDESNNNNNNNNKSLVIPTEKEFWCMESRHFRLITRLTKSLRLTDKEKRDMIRKRMNIYLKDPVYGPINSHAVTFPKSQRSSDVICYICHLPDIVGKFSIEKANEFGIVGIGRSKLCKGESVFSEKVGRMISPQEVLSPSTIGPAMIIIACPTIDYLNSIITNQKILSYSGSDPERSGCIVHMVPEEIFSLPEYCSFIMKFSNEKWQHIVLNKNCAYHELIPLSGQLVNGLNKVSPMFYPKLYPYSTSNPLPDSLSMIPNIQRGRFHQTIIMNPLSPLGHPLFDNSACIENQDNDFTFEMKSPSPPSSPSKSQIDNNISNLDSTTIYNKKRKSLISSSRNEFIKSQNKLIEGFSDRELELVFLGTGCSQTSLFRSETCILLNLFDKGSILFDTGGGAYSQLYRKYGDQETKQILSGLKFIFISHLHADHHQDLQKLLEARHLAMEELYTPFEKRSLVILSPPGANGYIRDLEKSFTLHNSSGGGSSFKGVWKYVQFFNFSNYQQDSLFSQFLKKQLGITKCAVVSVIHSFGAHGIMIESENGWKVSYSGDTSYCDDFVQLADNSTIVIHEATFHDCQQDKANQKRHCTFKDAINAFNHSNSHSTILTHFSQRYPNIKASLPISSGDDDEDYIQNVSYAFDFLTVNIKNLNLLPSALDGLKTNEADNEEVEDLDE
ncbi:hypothetical protein RB653_002739 [Dictyostelium firmibasis]|uniref:ribonuclease Z n=1 Tax=Dictyostelium firmibasis TaxID=79012 RepID=A0AAN7YT01_9MYCE